MNIRYTYSFHKSRVLAEMALEHMWAAGDVGTLEQPRIERQGKFYVITLNG